MSSLVRFCTVGLAACVVALTLAACGSDSEPTTEVADLVPDTTDTGPVDTTDTAAAERAEAERREAARKAAARKAAARKRAEERRKRRAEARRAERERQAEEARQREEEAARREADRQAAEEAAAREEARREAEQQPAGPVPHQLSETANLQLVSKKGVAFIQEGTVTGTYAGTMRLDAKLGGKGVEGTFTVQLKGGTLSGSAAAGLALAGARANFKGTASITSGTGEFKNVQPAQLAFSGSVKSDASSSTVNLSGTLSW